MKSFIIRAVHFKGYFTGRCIAMHCESSQRVIEKLHDVRVDKSIYQPQMDEALEHLVTCEQCLSWFNQNVCPKIQNESDEDIRMMHGMMHEPLGNECPYFKA